MAGSALNAPHDELQAAQDASQAAIAELDRHAIRRHCFVAFALGHAHNPAKHQETAPKGGLCADNPQRVTANPCLLNHDHFWDGVSSQAPIVEPRGIEPRSTSTIPCLLRA